MVDTIFYFAKNMDEYTQAKENGGVSSKTIVFVEDEHEIYLNGVGYGKTSTVGLLSEEEYKTWKDTILTRITNLADDVSKKNQDIVDKWLKELNELAGSLTARLSEINARINNTLETLDGIQKGLENDIKTSVEDMGDELKDLINNYDFDLKFGEWKNTAGLLTRDELNNIAGQWSTIELNYNTLSGKVNKMYTSFDEDGNIIATKALLSIIEAGIDAHDTAYSDIATRWAVLDENQEVIKWLASGFKSLAREDISFAQIYASAKDDTDSAISALKTTVDKINGEYISSAQLSTELQNKADTTSLADFALLSTLISSIANLSTVYETKENGEANTRKIADLLLASDANSAAIKAVTSYDESTKTYFLNESTVDSAVASILAKNSSSAAQVAIIAANESSSIDISTAVENEVKKQLDDGTFVTQQQINSSGFATKSDVQSSIATVSSNIQDSNGNYIQSSYLLAETLKNASKLSAIAEFNNDNTLKNFKGGVVTEATADGVISSLFAKDGSKLAGIVAELKNDISEVTVAADQIHLEGVVTANNAFTIDKNGTMTATGGKFTGDIVASSFSTLNTSDQLGIVVTSDSIQFRDGKEDATLGIAPKGKAYFSIDDTGQFRLNIWSTSDGKYYVPDFTNWMPATHNDVLLSESFKDVYYRMSENTVPSNLTTSELKDIYDRYVNYNAVSYTKAIKQYKAKMVSENNTTVYEAGDYCASVEDAQKYNNKLFVAGNTTSKLNDNNLCEDGLMFLYSRASSYQSAPIQGYDEDWFNDIDWTKQRGTYVFLTDNNTQRVKDSDNQVYRWYYDGTEVFWQDASDATLGKPLTYNNYQPSALLNNVINCCTRPEVIGGVEELIDPLFEIMFDNVLVNGEQIDPHNAMLWINKSKFEKAYNS